MYSAADKSGNSVEMLPGGVRLCAQRSGRVMEKSQMLTTALLNFFRTIRRNYYLQFTVGPQCLQQSNLRWCICGCVQILQISIILKQIQMPEFCSGGRPIKNFKQYLSLRQHSMVLEKHLYSSRKPYFFQSVLFHITWKNIFSSKSRMWYICVYV